MKKLLVLPATLLLTGCTVMDVVGPRPNKEIMALAKQAAADRTFSDGPAINPWRDLRKVQAEQLRDEALRLCGVDAHGETPSTCDVTFGDTDLPANADAEALLHRTVLAVDNVPPESVDLVVAQAIDAVALTPVRLESVNGELTAGDGDSDAVRAMADAEFRLQYGLSLALAHADDGLRARILDLRDSSRDRVTALGRLIPGGAEELVPEAGYELLVPEPASLEEAAELVSTLQRDLITQWRSVAADAEGSDWMTAAIRLAAHAQQS